MTTITEARQDISTGSTNKGGSGSQPKPGLGELWLAILALVAVVGLAVAVAFGVLDDSSKTDAITVVDPRADADFHREPSAANQGMDSDVHREINQQASKAAASVAAADPRLDADFHREAPAVNNGMDSDVYRELNQQASKASASVAYVDPRLDADFHRDAPAANDGTDAPTPYVNSGLDPETQLEIYEQAQADGNVDPREDADHHRES